MVCEVQRGAVKESGADHYKAEQSLVPLSYLFGNSGFRILIGLYFMQHVFIKYSLYVKPG